MEAHRRALEQDLPPVIFECGELRHMEGPEPRFGVGLAVRFHRHPHPPRPLASTKQSMSFFIVDGRTDADFEAPIESLGRPWRIFVDPDAVREVLDFAEDFHWEMERRDREAILINKVKYQRGENDMLLEKVVELSGTVKNLNSQTDSLSLDDRVNQLIKQCPRSDVIYLVGGLDDISCPSSLGFSCFSPSLDMLIPVKSMPDERLFNATVALDNRIFVLGGADHPYASCIDTGAASFYVYLPKSSLVAVSALIYAFNLYLEVCCYDTTCDDWTLCPPMTCEKANLARVSLCGKIYAFGGGDGSESFLDVEVFDPAYGKWIKNQPMLKKRSALAGVGLNGAIYAVGGYSRIGNLSCAERLDPREPYWKMLPGMSTQRSFHTLAVLDEKIYSIGGYNPEAGAGVATVELYDPRMPSWVEVEPMKITKATGSGDQQSRSLVDTGARDEVDYDDGASYEMR
ncbi:LOW QUALITY PROTEIN: kelch-like protein 8 [Hordeum vulgare subsp. vulgare]|uniref:LOW QUALITY PROTEIN: kelch-like protein 8 n=1 Tax=Hordeum vulgare subsp. vulgare TaxID=112509 RepID=UPI001D1A45F9|nr:LOW QUALITY PROTEIN: kelch-like protein 8 [Hordeum vulgare subsp. vulgare]